jgi:crossover junction endodeoxyribonuclease RuvC
MIVIMKILGIDPGIGIVGFGLINVCGAHAPKALDWGTLITNKTHSDAERLLEIYTDLTQLLIDLAPDVVSVERIFFFKNAKTLVPVSQARGVILLCIQAQGLGLAEYTPMQVKQALTGYGKSTKQEIQAMVAQQLGLPEPPRPDDAADALAMAICHAQFARASSLGL